MITYDKLWKTMKEKQMTQYRLIRYYGFSAGQIGRLKKNMYVSTHTLEVLCQILNCRIEDIVEYIPDEEQQEITRRPGQKNRQLAEITKTSIALRRLFGSFCLTKLNMEAKMPSSE